MARLSAAANETPRSERKSKGIRNLFKHRDSSSISSSPANMPPLDDSTLPSPTVRPGFKQIGLLPSERSYSSLWSRDKKEERGRKSSVSTATQEDHSPKSSKTAHSKDCGLTHVDDEHERMRQASQSRLQSLNDALSNYPDEQVAHEAAVAEVAAAEMNPATIVDTDKRISLPLGSSHRIAQAMHEKNDSSRGNIGLSGVQNLSLGSFYVPQSDSEADPEEFRDSLSPEYYNVQSFEKTKDFLKSRRMSEHPPQLGSFAVVPTGVEDPLPLTPREPEHDATTIEEDDSGHRRSFASNILDDDSSLRQGIREYVASKIAEALVEHDKKLQDRMQDTPSAPVHVTVNIDMAGLAKTSEVKGKNEKKNKKKGICEGPFTIGPYTFPNELAGLYWRIGIHILYMIYFTLPLVGLYYGYEPRAGWLALCGLGVFVIAYCNVAEQLGWAKKIQRDVVLAPVLDVLTRLLEVFNRLLFWTRIIVVYVIADALKAVVEGVNVRVTHG